MNIISNIIYVKTSLRYKKWSDFETITLLQEPIRGFQSVTSTDWGQYFRFGHYAKFMVLLLENDKHCGKGPTQS